MQKITTDRFQIIKLCSIIILLMTLGLASPVFADADTEVDPIVDSEGWRVWGEEYWPTLPVRGGVTRAAAPVYIGLMNPNHFPVLDWFSMSFMYEKLINFDARQQPTIPWLAESWEYLDDVTVLMKLRPNVSFHDGSEFNAESLKYQMEWILDKQNRAWIRTWLEPLESIEVIDQLTVKWHFKRPWGAFLGTMASVPGFMISQKALEGDSAITESKQLQRQIVTAKRKLKKANQKRSYQAKKEAEAKQNREEDELEVVIFKMADEEYAFNIDDVSEIIDMTDITPVADSVKHIKGVINIRGQVISIASLYGILDFVENTDLDQKIIVTNVQGNSIGFVVDKVNDVRGIADSEIKKEEDNNRLFSNILQLEKGKRLVMMFDTNVLLSSLHLDKAIA